MFLSAQLFRALRFHFFLLNILDSLLTADLHCMCVDHSKLATFFKQSLILGIASSPELKYSIFL